MSNNPEDDAGGTDDGNRSDDAEDDFRFDDDSGFDEGPRFGDSDSGSGDPGESPGEPGDSSVDASDVLGSPDVGDVSDEVADAPLDTNADEATTPVDGPTDEATAESPTGVDADAAFETDDATFETDEATAAERSSDENASAEGGSVETADASTDRIRAALAEVRREVRKAAVVHAAVDAALAALLANLVLALVEPSALAGAIGLPAVVTAALGDLPLLGGAAPRTVQLASLVAVAIGVVAFAAAYALRLRRPLIEQFEAANPGVREALRTARDAVDDGTDTEMARRLYGDVIATLRQTSSLELVETRRVVVTVLVIVLVSLASVQVAVVDPDLGGLLGGGNGDTGIDQPDDDGLQDGDQILGDPEDVQAGDDLENISVPGTGEGSGDGPTGPSDGLGGGGGSGEFDSQQAGFAGEERIEDAELVREYNLRIRGIDEGSEAESDGGSTADTADGGTNDGGDDANN
jgi:hypothetical protein